MDSAIERGEFEEAATMSDRLVQREVLPGLVDHLLPTSMRWLRRWSSLGQAYGEHSLSVYISHFLSPSLLPRSQQPLTATSL